METALPPAHKTRVSALLYLAVAFVAFFPCLVLGKAYWANDLVYYPFRYFLRLQFAAGHFPLWNPYLLGGQPLLANPNYMMFYPLNYLTLLFPVPYADNLHFFIHMFIAALGMHFFLRSLRLSDGACRLGAVTYCLSNFFWWELIHPQLLASFSWFPWFLFALEKLSKERTARRAFLAGLTYATIFVCSNFQVALGFFYTGFLYFFFRMVETDGIWASFSKLFTSKENLKKAVLLGLFALWGAVPLFFLALPAAELAGYSTRAVEPYDTFAGTYSMKPFTVYEFLFSTLGVPPGQTIENAVQQVTDTVNYDNEFLGIYGYLGVWLPFLVFFAFKRKEKKLIWLLAGLSVLSLSIAFGRYFFVHRLLYLAVPGFKFVRCPFRYIDTYIACVCVLAAYGFQTLEHEMEDKGLASKRSFMGLLYALVLLMVSFTRPQETWREIIALTLGLAGLSLWGWTESWKKMGRLFFVAGLVLPLLFTGWSDFSLGDPSNYDYKAKFPVTATLGETYKASRFYLDASHVPFPLVSGGRQMQQAAPEDLAEVLGFRIMNGYDSIGLKSAADLKQLPQNVYGKLMGLRGILVGQDGGDQPGYQHHPLDSVHLYESLNPPAFVTAPFQLQTIPDPVERLAAMKNLNFDPSTQAILSLPLPPEAASQLSNQKAELKFDLVQDEPNRQLFKMDLDKNSLVVVSEIMFPGWKAWVDGKPSPLFTANHAFRALVLSAGSHQVEFKFEPPWAKPLLAAVILWVLSAGIYGFLSFRRRDQVIEKA